MKRKWYSVEQIIAAIKQHELGTLAGEIIRKLGIAEATSYQWKHHYGGLEPDQARELKQLGEKDGPVKRAANLSGIQRRYVHPSSVRSCC